MTGSSQGWRGNRETRRGNQTDQSAAPAWKQSRRRADAAGSRGLPWFRILLALGFLSSLVAIAIFIFSDPPRQLTFIDVLAAYRTPGQANESRQNHWGGTARPAEFQLPQNAINQASEVRISGSLDNMTGDWMERLLDLRKTAGFRGVDGEAIVLYLQSGFVPGQNNRLHLLNGQPASPDLEISESQDLDELKQTISRFIQDRPHAGVLLLVDTPPLNHPLRYGQTGGNAVQQLLSWPREESLKRLVVIAAATDGQVSWPAAMGAHGQTAFAWYAAAAFTSSADTDGNKQITVSEYAGFLKEKTEKWVT
ncbi:MAG: hypothetical protein KDA85_04210, partial [Planctomycetaceae bacterium]|nr:hypothetical protein [Planctomycetaceae bacterium]